MINKFKRAHKTQEAESVEAPQKWNKFYKDEVYSAETDKIATINSKSSSSKNLDKFDRNGEYHSDSVGSNLSLIPSIDTNRD